MMSSTMTIENEQDMKVAMGGFNCELYIDQHPVLAGSHNTSVNEDLFIEDLSEFSNEDIGAPIKSTTHTRSPGSDLLQDSTLDFKAALLNEFQDSSLSLPCQDETGFEWLTSLGEDDLIGDGSNFGMDSFLPSNAETLNDDYGIRMMKHGEYEDAIKVRDMNMGQNSISTTSTLENEQPVGHENRMWDADVSGLKSYNATNFASHATGSRSARSKRARSSGWSSGSGLCRLWPPESPSPTDSLNSTSQISMPINGPQYSSTPSFLYKQEDTYTTTSHGNMDINFTPRLINDSNSDSSKGNELIRSSKHSWPKENNNIIREESVSNYGSGLQPRRCTHCLSQKTPQWRAGPEGPKTLCNACGVRYKSGRLFDEYRPAKSPTFLSYKHSSSHKKVMEMRRRKVFQYSQQQPQHVMHHVRALPAKQANVGNQHLNSKFKVKLNSPPHSELPASTHFSDVTLISTRNALESPSSFLY